MKSQPSSERSCKKHVSRETYSSEICKKIGFRVLYKICELQNLRELRVRRRSIMLTGALGEKWRAETQEQLCTIWGTFETYPQPMKRISRRVICGLKNHLISTDLIRQSEISDKSRGRKPVHTYPQLYTTTVHNCGQYTCP